MWSLAGLLGDPQKGIKCVHVAGTKGKGSTACFIYSILKKAGYRTGLYTSPHLLSFRERIRINDELISESDIARLLDKIRGVVSGMESGNKPTFFEIYTALAYLYFKEKAVDLAVYEVGLGGRLDATNIIEPLVSAITPISYEHTQKLGLTLAEIAAEKSGIIKGRTICVSAPQEPEALDVIKHTCEKKGARLILVGEDINFEELYFNETRSGFNIYGLLGKYEKLESRLLGPHQVINAAAAIGVVEALNFSSIKIDKNAVREGVADARWEGRLEIIARHPYVIVDGAQNASSAKALAASVKKIFSYRKLILVLGVSKDKDIKGILKELLPLADSVILTKARIAERAAEPERIKEFITGCKSEIGLTSDVEAAVTLAREKASGDDLVLITGSLYVVGDAKSFIQYEQK